VLLCSIYKHPPYPTPLTHVVGSSDADDEAVDVACTSLL
jgi:hypothetical protein